MRWSIKSGVTSIKQANGLTLLIATIPPTLGHYLCHSHTPPHIKIIPINEHLFVIIKKNFQDLDRCDSPLKIWVIFSSQLTSLKPNVGLRDSWALRELHGSDDDDLNMKSLMVSRDDEES